MPTTAENEYALCKLVTQAYIERGHDLTVAEIAAYSNWNWTEAKIRKVINAAHGCPRALTCSQTSRVRRVWVYGPSRETLRLMLRKAAELWNSAGARFVECPATDGAIVFTAEGSPAYHAAEILGADWERK